MRHASTDKLVQLAREVSWLLVDSEGKVTPERFSKSFPDQLNNKELFIMDRKEAMSKILMISEKNIRQAYCNLHKHPVNLENATFLGVHTLVPRLLNAPNVFLNTILKGNGGRLPPYSICMGDKRRVRFAANFLDSGTVTVFEHTMLSNGENCGRVEMAAGLYKGTPIVLFEHQMGCPPVEITMKEILSDECMAQTFDIDDHTFVSDAKYIIRVGSCAGINHPTTPSNETVNLYDIIVASHQVGVSSTDVQCMTGNLNPCDPEYASGTRQILEKYGYTFDKHWPIVEVDPNFSNILVQAARRLISTKGNVHLAGNVSKDSLYAEATEEAFTDMRKHQNVASSEMEFSTIMKVCRELTMEKGISCHGAMILVAVGVLPGESFGNDHVKENERTKVALLSAMEALHSISEIHKQDRKVISKM